MQCGRKIACSIFGNLGAGDEGFCMKGNKLANRFSQLENQKGFKEQGAQTNKQTGTNTKANVHQT